MDDIDHVLNYLREEYSYRIWALVGHSRGANAAFHYVVMRDRSIPLIVNCSARFTSELFKARVEKFYPGGLQHGSFIEMWKYPGGVIRERRTSAEEVFSMSRVDNKLGIILFVRMFIVVAQLPPSVSVLTIFGSADHVFLLLAQLRTDRPNNRCNALGKHSPRPAYPASHPGRRSQLFHSGSSRSSTRKQKPTSCTGNSCMARLRKRTQTIHQKSGSGRSGQTLEKRGRGL